MKEVIKQLHSSNSQEYKNFIGNQSLKIHLNFVKIALRLLINHA